MTTALISLLSLAALILLAPQIMGIILHFLPNSIGLPTAVHDVLTFAVDKLNGLSFMFPVSDMITILILVLVIEAALLALKFVIRIVKTIRGTA